MPKVSIVIPAFNREKTLARAVESVVDQRHRELEIIIVDDGSTDNTAELASRLVDLDSRVKYVRHLSNKGAQAARNTGARAANGLWISFLDSDDYFLPGSIENRLEAAIRAESAVVHSECTVILDKDFQPFGVPQMQGYIYTDLLRRPGPMFQGMLVRKDALEKIGYLDESINSYQEWDSSIRLAKYFAFAFVSEPTFVYDCRGSDTISKNMLRDVNGYRQVVLKHREAILQSCGRGAIAEHYNQIANRYKALAMQKEYVAYIMKSFVAQPSRGAGFAKRIVSKAKHIVLPDSAQPN